jgi:hypothetical protein
MKALKTLIIVLIATFSFSAVNAQVDHHPKPRKHYHKPVRRKHRKPVHHM